jgi:hypothetical protein
MYRKGKSRSNPRHLFHDLRPHTTPSLDRSTFDLRFEFKNLEKVQSDHIPIANLPINSYEPFFSTRCPETEALVKPTVAHTDA